MDENISVAMNFYSKLSVRWKLLLPTLNALGILFIILRILGYSYAHIEGIETEDQAELLRVEGCDFIQGYHLSRPLFEEDAIKFVSGRKKL